MEYQLFAVIPAFKTCRLCQNFLFTLLFIILILASIQQFPVQSSDTGLPAQTASYAGKKGDSLQPKMWLKIRPPCRM